MNAAQKKRSKNPSPWLGLLLLSGCQPEAPTDLPSEYTNPEEEPPPLLSMAEIEAGLPAVLSETFRFDPRQVLPTYESFRSLGESQGDCPFYFSEEVYGSTAWFTQERCEANGGAVFDSNGCLIQSIYSLPGDYVDEAGNIYQEHLLLSGSADIVDTQGGRFHFGGDLFLDVFSNPGSNDLYTSAFLDGAFLQEGESTQTSWLEQPVSWGFMSVQAGDEVSTGAKTLLMSGSISGLQGSLGAVFYSTSSLQTSDGATCDLEPAGAILVRDDVGYWYAINYQGPEAAGDFTDECDGCGYVTDVEGVFLGTVCNDLSPLVNWQGNPWAGRQ